MTRFGALVFLILCLNISVIQAQQCQEFKDGFKIYFKCVLNCYKMYFGPRFAGGDLCTSEITIDETTDSESGYTADDVDLSFDCIARQCTSEIPPSVCEDSSTLVDSTVSTPVSTSESGSTTSSSSTSFEVFSDSTSSEALSDPTSSTDASDLTSSADVSEPTSSSSLSDLTSAEASTGPTESTSSIESFGKSGLITETQFDSEDECEDSVDAEAAADSNNSPLSTTDAPDNTDYTYEYYYDYDDYAEASANASSSADGGKASAEGSASAFAQSQNNENAQPQNNGNIQPQSTENVQPQNNGNVPYQNNNKTSVDTNMQNSNNGNGYNYNGEVSQSFDAPGPGNNDRQIDKNVPASNSQYQNFENQKNNQNQYYYERPDVQPVYNQPKAINQNFPLQPQADDYTSGSQAYASSAVGNGRAVASADTVSANGGEISESAYSQPQKRNFQSQNNDKKSIDTNIQRINSGNDGIPQSSPVARTDDNSRYINQQVSATNSQYQNFGNQRNNPNQYYYQNPAVQPVYNYPQTINQNSASQQLAGGNIRNSQQTVYSVNGYQVPTSNNAFGYSSQYANSNSRVAPAAANNVGSGGSPYGYNPSFMQNNGAASNYGSRSAASANSGGSAANGGGAKASADAFSSAANAKSSSGNFNPPSLGDSPNNNGDPIRLNFGDDTLVIHGNQVQWHRNDQLVNFFTIK